MTKQKHALRFCLMALPTVICFGVLGSFHNMVVPQNTDSDNIDVYAWMFSNNVPLDLYAKTKNTTTTTTADVPNVSLTIQATNRTSHVRFTSQWRTSSVIPQWMKRYFQWHQQVRRELELVPENWTAYDYLIVRCLERDERCGGGADRLLSLPFMILFASRTNRLLLYAWEKPAPLQAFLVPPPDGLNWTWPPSRALDKFPNGALLQNTVSEHLGVDYRGNPVLERPKPVTTKFAYMKYQTANLGSAAYNALRSNETEEATFQAVFRHVWYSVFVPSQPVEEAIHKQMNFLQLRPNQYHSIHIRSRYKHNISQQDVERSAQNSLNCLVDLLAHDNSSHFGDGWTSSNTSIFVSTDNDFATRSVMNYAAQRGWKGAVQIPGNGPVLHLERGTQYMVHKGAKQWTKHELSEYYGTFVDLYTLSWAKCQVTGMGNYGRWANLLSSNVQCHVDTSNENSSPFSKQCSWPETTT